MRRLLVILVLVALCGAPALTDAARGRLRHGTPPTPPASQPPPPPPTQSCSRYISPGGGGTGLTSGSPYRLSDFLNEAVADMTGCMLNGTYTGSIGMVKPPTGRSGSSGHPIRLVALNDGGAVVDAEFKNTDGTTWGPGGDSRHPLELISNNWWEIEGIDFIRSAGDVCDITTSNNVTLRRVICRDGNLTRNRHLIQTINSSSITFEDVAAFGPGRYGIVLFQTTDTTLRRVWVRHEGSTTDTITGPKEGINLVYDARGVTNNNTCENCIATWYPISMPSTFKYTCGEGNEGNGSGICVAPGTGLSGSGATIAEPVGPFGTEANPPDGAGTKWYGSIGYVLPSYFVSTGSKPRTILHNRFASSQTVKDFVWFTAGYSGGSSITGGTLDDGAITSGNTLDDVTFIKASGASDFFSTGNWTITNFQSGLSATGVNNVFTSALGATGANVCHRYINGARTTQVLWPWPMNSRIQAATAAAGAYGGPCVGCSGGRGVRAAVDVTADIEFMLGTIPAQCRQ